MIDIEKKIQSNSIQKHSNINREKQIKIYSKKLISNLKIEKCNGDFCEYSFSKSNKMISLMQNENYLGENQLNYKQKLLGSEEIVLYFFRFI